jgi:acylphosphatase
VWFRESCREQAQMAGVGGWVRNLADGRVEVVLEGPRAAVDRVVAWCHRGPRRARVERVETVDEAPVGEGGFHVR